MSETKSQARPVQVAIIGAGPGGMCMAIKLKQAGFENIVLIEKNSGVGGTWHHNVYPGCACDIPAHLYSFSFDIKLDWSRPYAPQPEILAYMEGLAAKYDLLKHCRFDTTVEQACWDEDAARWTLELDSGETLSADIVVSAIGMFNDLVWPDIDGLDAFEGTSFHSARWNWDHSLAGERVAVIGSAASAVQFIPEIVQEAGQVHLYQRTANWVMPKEDDPYTEEQLEHFRKNPELVMAIRKEIFERVDGGMTFQDPVALSEMQNACLANIDVVEDPELRERLTPDHPFGCKRPLASNIYYPCFNRPNLELVTDPIERITKKGVVTADGREREVDTLIISTGFSATKYLSAIDVVGRGGQHINDAWRDGAQAYLGITTSGFPNLFMLYGPNTNNGSILTMIESQADYVVRQTQRIANERLAWIDVRPESMERYNEEVQRAIDGVPVWNASCNGYYRTPSGRVVTQWPFSMTEFRERTSKPDAEHFEAAPLQETAHA